MNFKFKIKNNHNKTLLHTFFFVLSIIYWGCYYPSYYNQFLFGEHFKGIIYCIIIVILWIFTKSIITKDSKLYLPDKSFTILLSIEIFYQLFRYLILNELSSLSTIPRFVVSWIGIILIINTFQEKVYMKYLNKGIVLMIFSTILGIIIWATQGLTIFSTQNIPDTNMSMLNFGFFFTKYSNTLTGDFYRPAGWFDEPGSFSNVILFFLIYNKLKLKSNIIELILIIGGLFTMSIAHCVISFLYIIFFYINRKNAKYLIILFSLIITFYLWKPQKGLGEFAWNAVFGRIEIVINGEDKSRDYDSAKKAFDNYFLTGEADNIIKNKYPSATVETIWFFGAQNGIIGSIIYLLPILYIFYSLHKRGELNSTQIKLLLLLIFNLGQRPSYTFPLYLMLIYFIWYNKKQYLIKFKSIKKYT